MKRQSLRRGSRAKKPDEIVGENRDSHSCPLALFYAEKGGNEILIFDDGLGGHLVDRGYSRRPLPPWASSFVHEVDGDQDGKITAKRALEALLA